jgi:hypothetical protein
VCRLGEQLARGLLAQDVLFAIGARKLVGRVGLTEAELYVMSDLYIRPGHGSVSSYLLQPQRSLESGHMLVNIPLQRLEVYRLAHFSRHNARCKKRGNKRIKNSFGIYTEGETAKRS